MAEIVQAPFDIRAAQKEGVASEAIGQFNAEVSRRQGEEGLRRKTEEARLLRRRAQKIRGSNIAKGAPLHLLEESATNAQIDQLRTLEDASIAKSAGEQQAGFDLLKGKIGKEASKRKITASLIKAGSKAATLGFSLGTGGGF